jgi:methylamine---glutamate N-methyltransferase subunit B
MEGCNIVVGGSVGHLSAVMAQAGTLVVCGDAGPSLGDSLYEAVIYVRGRIHSLGIDAREEPMTDLDYLKLQQLLTTAQMKANPRDFKRVASAKTLYHWNVEAGQEY